MAADSGIPGHLPHQLAHWWEHGEGAAKIRWGQGGDFDRCVRLAVDEAHMDPERAKGFCAERHHAALGIWPATHAAMEKHAGRAAMTEPGYDADGLDGSWDGDCSDLPDLTGLDVSHFEAAEGAGPSQDSASRAMPKLGTGKRFAKLKSSLAAKGAKDPGALAAYIGRKKFGKAKFSKIAAKARGEGGASRMDQTRPASASRALVEIRRDCQLEDIHIVRTAQGDSTGRVVEAYASVFDQPVEIRDHQGHYTEVIDRASFNDVLAHIRRSRGGLPASVKVLYNHGKTMEGDPAPEFQKPLGKPLFVEPESRGLLTRTEYSKTALGEEVLELVRDGAITAQSFVGALTRSDPELRGPGDRHRARNGVLPVVRRMVLGLREYGPVLWAAYSGAEILGVRMQLPGDAPEDLDDPLDEECGPDEEEAAAGSVPEDTTTARYHQHALYRMTSEDMRKKAGLVW